MDWTQIWYDEFKKYGEGHVFIVPNAEHGLVTNLLGVLSSMTTFFKSIINETPLRPDYSYQYNNLTGELSVNITSGREKLKHVRMWHASTMQSERRDFRWAIKDHGGDPKCKFPYIQIPHHKYGGVCTQFVFWWHQDL